MSLRNRTQIASFAVCLLSVGLLVGWSFAQRAAGKAKPEQLLPERAIVYLHANGSLLTADAYQQTAAYQALHETGLIQLLEDAFEQLTADQETFAELEEAIEHLEAHGMSLVLTDGVGMQPWGMVVFHDGAGGADLVRSILEQIPIPLPEWQQVQRDGRDMTITMIPNTPLEVAFWEEQGHLVLVAGLNAIQSALSVANGEQPNLTTNPLYQQYKDAPAGVTVQTVGWFDFAPLRQMYGAMPLPIPGEQAVTVQNVLEVLGLDTLDHLAGTEGFQGKANWSEQVVKVTGEASGLMALLLQEPISLSDLPPLPAGFNGMLASSFDWGKAYAAIIGMLERAAVYAPPGTLDNLDPALEMFENEFGFSLEKLFNSLGHVHCIYSDTNQGLFGLGGAAVVSVNDAETLREALAAIFERIEIQSDYSFYTYDEEKQGRTLTMLRFSEAPFLTPAICVDDDWLIIGLYPQSIETCLLRLDGKLPHWQPTAEYAEILTNVPEKFTGLALSDPRGMYRMLLSLAPTLIGAIEMGVNQSGMFPDDFELPIYPEDFPPAEVVAAPLFPNLTVTTIDADGVRTVTRSSLPGIPMTGGSDGAVLVATGGILVALLLPAVQSAREAARRTQSRNNLKMIGLALHNYHDVFRHFPQGTYPNDDLEVEDRLSWLYHILPYVEEAPLYNQMNGKAGWQDDANDRFSTRPVPTYLHPSDPVTQVDGYGVSHYVGVAGVGEQGPTLPANHPKAGIFAYNRVTRMRDIRDGTSNTIAVGETDRPAPWAAGGPGTIRPLVKQPYINGGNAFGSKSPGGANFLFADGSVRFISENVDPEVLEALSTIAGNEVIRGDDF